MDNGRRGNLAAVIALAAVLVGAAGFFGPGMYRSVKFQQTCDRMLADALAGNLNSVSSYVLPDQQKLTSALFQTAVPANYQDYLQSLKLSSFATEQGNPRVIWALVTAKLGEGMGSDAGGGLAQGKLRWVWNGQSWEWDFEGSYGAQFPVSGEANWVRLGDFITIESPN